MRSSILGSLLLLSIPGLEARTAPAKREGKSGQSSLMRAEGDHGTESHVVMQRGSLLPHTPQLLASISEDSSAEVSVEMWNRAAQEAPYYTDDEFSCRGKRNAWILVEDPVYEQSPGDKEMLRQLRSKSPFCATVLKLPKPPRGRTFWELKVVAIRDYILDHPNLQFVASTDAYDVYLNPATEDELFSRFRRLTEGRAAMVMSTEQTCWFGHLCTQTEASNWIGKLRDSMHRSDVKSFINSQYMGERSAVLAFLDHALGATPGQRGFPDNAHKDDQGMFSKAVAERPDLVTVDWDEVIFASMGRGMVPGHNTGSDGKRSTMMCNFGGPRTESCISSRNWGDCARKLDSTVVVHDFHSDRIISPIVWHFNGPSPRVIKGSKHCHDAFFRDVGLKDMMLFRALSPTSSRMAAALSGDYEYKDMVDV